MKRRMKMPQEEALELQFNCPECGRSFATGKGLGGHKRMHMEAEKRNNRTQQEAAELPQPENHSCPVCQQPFPSEKAVYGHMRKHPDRGWRGMNPPAPAEENPLAIVPVAAANELMAPAEDRPIPNRSGSSNGFVCDACGRAFKSYHALGGHKSHHGRNNKAVYMEQVGGSVGGGEEKGKKSPLGFAFDLNELPPESSGHGEE